MIDGGPAFPLSVRFINEQDKEIMRREYLGMTLRDYFAGQALNGLAHGYQNELSEVDDVLEICKHCYRYADAMLKEREAK